MARLSYQSVNSLGNAILTVYIENDRLDARFSYDRLIESTTLLVLNCEH